MPKLIDIIEQGLAPIPHVALEALELVDASDSTAGDLAALIAQDQSLTSRVLQLANSAFYGARGSVDSVSRAIVTLGWRQVRELVLAASFQSQYRAISFSDRMLWDHALAVSRIARKLATRCHYPKVDEASTAGLMHDIGKVVMDQHAPDQYREVTVMLEEPGMTCLIAEQEIFGFTHAEVGEMVVTKWGLSDALQEVVLLHHDPQRAEVDPVVVAIVSLANSVCVQQGIGLESLPELDLLSLDATSILGLDQEQIAELLDEMDMG